MASSKVVATQKLGFTVEPLQILQTLVEYGDKWVTEIERARTARADIAAWEQVQTDRIRAQRDVMLKALDLTFDERRSNFNRLFDGLDAAIAAGDTSQANRALESITDLAKQSPFKDLANIEIIVTDLKRPDKEWDV